METQKTFIPILIVAVAVAAFGGYYVGMQRLSGELIRYQKALERFVPLVPDEVMSTGGTVKEVGDNLLVIESPSLSAATLPGEEPVLQTRKIAVTSDTVLVKTDPLFVPTAEEMKKGNVTSPEKTIQLSDIKSGDIVSVEAGENIKTKLDFAAKKIVLFVR